MTIRVFALTVNFGEFKDHILFEDLTPIGVNISLILTSMANKTAKIMKVSDVLWFYGCFDKQKRKDIYGEEVTDFKSKVYQRNKWKR